MAEPKLTALDTNRMPWGALDAYQLNAKIPVKDLLNDPDTGMQIFKIRYERGFVNVSHYHHCAHYMYVLDGILHTHDGDYGPGSFVSFPEGLTMHHGATAENDVDILFITNKPFDIHYTHLEGGEK